MTFKRIFIILLLTISFATGLKSAKAQGFSEPIWLAEYWDNQYLHGSPEVVREENYIDYNWGDDSPDEDIDNDTFSARWTANVPFEAGTYSFNATSDDGVRVWVDGDLIINAWDDHEVETFSAIKWVSDGPHHVVVEYYEHDSGAIAQFWWAPAPPSDNQNWVGEYFNNIGLRGSPEIRREDANISFNWDGVSPALGVEQDTFSVRWNRTLNLPAGNYTFRLTTDDGARLWVNGRQLINAWYVQSPHTYQGNIYLAGGPIPVRLEYFNQSGGAFVQLTWSQTLDSPQLTQTWRGEYYDNINFIGGPEFVRQDAAIDFNWGLGSPDAAELGTDRFAVRWTRMLSLPAGRYQFNVTSDDGARLWIGDRLLIDGWRIQSPTSYSGQVTLSNQPVSIRMEYFEDRGGAVARLSWNRIDFTEQERPYTSDQLVFKQAIPSQSLARWPTVAKTEPNPPEQ
jgi:hypothetical protein